MAAADALPARAPLAALEVELAALAESFIARHSRRPEQSDIAADAAWSALYTEKKTREREGAVRAEGGCSVYIVRRRRYCTHAAADGLGGLCSEHAAAAAPPQPLLPHRVPEADAAAAAAASGHAVKRNLKRRMKRMTNPRAHAAPVAAPDWGALFADTSLPTLLDIGCAKGRFLAALATSAEFAARHGAHNFVGVEVFAPLADAANSWRDAAGLRNLHYIGANANASLASLAIPRLQRVCIQFPDPWHDDNAARRVVTPALAALLAASLPCGGEVFVVSDVRRVALQMRTVLLATGEFRLHPLHATAGAQQGWGEPGDSDSDDDPGSRRAGGGARAADAASGSGGHARRAPPDGGWLRLRPYGVPTERDKVCEAKWRAVYRTLLVRA
jgi:tRNA (guanine-N7-)-methyltransferase